MESWIVYDIATGEELFAGQGTTGAAASQWVPEGAAIVVVPAAVVASRPRDYAPLKVEIERRIDAAAEVVRARFATSLPLQVGTYLMKEAAARRWLADPAASTVMLQPEATGRGMTLTALAAEVIARYEQWAVASGLIEGARWTAKTRLAAATNLAGIVAAGVIDWSVIDAPAA